MRRQERAGRTCLRPGLTTSIFLRSSSTAAKALRCQPSATACRLTKCGRCMRSSNRQIVMSRWYERLWAATILALLTGGAAAADGVTGRGHAFRADIVIVRGTKVLLGEVATPDDGERCVVDAGIMACGDAARRSEEHTSELQ